MFVASLQDPRAAEEPLFIEKRIFCNIFKLEVYLWLYFMTLCAAMEPLCYLKVKQNIIKGKILAERHPQVPSQNSTYIEGS